MPKGPASRFGKVSQVDVCVYTHVKKLAHVVGAAHGAAKHTVGKNKVLLVLF